MSFLHSFYCAFYYSCKHDGFPFTGQFFDHFHGIPLQSLHANRRSFIRHFEMHCLVASKEVVLTYIPSSRECIPHLVSPGLTSPHVTSADQNHLTNIRIKTLCKKMQSIGTTSDHLELPRETMTKQGIKSDRLRCPLSLKKVLSSPAWVF